MFCLDLAQDEAQATTAATEKICKIDPNGSEFIPNIYICNNTQFCCTNAGQQACCSNEVTNDAMWVKTNSDVLTRFEEVYLLLVHHWSVLIRWWWLIAITHCWWLTCDDSPVMLPLWCHFTFKWWRHSGLRLRLGIFYIYSKEQAIMWGCLIGILLLVGIAASCYFKDRYCCDGDPDEDDKHICCCCCKRKIKYKKRMSFQRLEFYTEKLPWNVEKKCGKLFHEFQHHVST